MAGKTASPDTTVRVKFLKPWSSDRGYFARGEEADLPESVAVALSLEYDPARNAPDPVAEIV